MMKEKITFFIEKKKCETSEDELTVRQILVDYGGYNPQENVLVLKHGHELQEMNNLDQVIEMKDGMQFSTFSKKPNPVS